MSPSALRIEDLAVDGPGGPLLRSVSLEVPKKSTVALVGESGCGKSLTAWAALALLPAGMKARGRVLLGDANLLEADEGALQAVRGRRVALVPQDALASLDPVTRVGDQLAELARVHLGMGRGAARVRAVEMLERVHVTDPELRARAFPHELSGGLRQRVVLAMALICRPDVLIADEPTSALDVTIQAQILALLQAEQRESDMGILLMTHDLAVVAETCTFVSVMCGGAIVERGTVPEVFGGPAHPYTAALLAAIPGWLGETVPPRIRSITAVRDARVEDGCRYLARCPQADESCATVAPPLVHIGGSGRHQALCHHPLRSGA